MRDNLTMRRLIAIAALAVCIFTVTGRAFAAVPDPPSLISPANGTNVPGTIVPFRWTEVTDATDYYLQVATDAGFTNIIFDDWIGNYIGLNISGFPDNGQTYYWRVAAGNSLGSSYFSITWSFVNGPSAVPDNNGTIDSTAQNPSHIYTNPGIYAVKLTVTDSDGSTQILTRASYITVNTVNNPDISASPAGKNFGSVDPGSSSTAQTFTISNTGTADLVIGTISLTGTHASEFSMQNNNCSNQRVIPSGTCTVNAVFSPASAGTKGANLSIPSNDPDTPTLELQLSGAGVDISLDGIVDNTDTGFSVIGNWRTYSVTNPNIYGPDLRYHAPGTGTERAVWDAELTHGPGTYKVMVWYLKHSAHASNAPFTVNHGGVSDTVLVNQQINGGQWVTLGFYDFADDGTEDVTLTDDADGWVIADAVRFVFVDTVDGIVDNTDTGFSVVGEWGTNANVSGFYGEDFRFHAAGAGSSIATWTTELTDGAGKYEVFIRYPINDAFAANAPYTINHADGSDTVPVNQSVKGGKWVSIGIYDFTDDSTEYVSLSDNADSWVAADAVMFVRR